MLRAAPARRVLAVGATLATGALVLAGCGQPPWKAAGGATPSAGATPTVSASATPLVAPSPVHNDLAKGSLKRRLTAGGVNLAVNYWSTLDLQAWTPQVPKPVNLSATGSFADGYKQDIYLTAVTMAVAVNGPSGPLESPAVQSDEATTQPGYVITKPNSYGGVFTVPAVDPAATSVTITFTYQVLQQTAPTSKTFSKQTAVDTITVPLAAG